MSLSERQRAFLADRRFGSLATVNADGSPHQTVMWFLLEGDEVMFNTTRDRVKPSNLARDPRVSLLVSDEYRYVRVTGVAREAAVGEEALRDIERLAVRYDGEASAARQMPRFRTHERVTYRFAIRRVYSSADLR